MAVVSEQGSSAWTDGGWPAGTRVRIRNYVGVGETGIVVHDSYQLNRLIGGEWSYEVRFDDWHFPNQRYWEHELERL